MNFTDFDLIMLAVIAINYVLRGDRRRGALHDPFSLAAGLGTFLSTDLAIPAAAATFLGDAGVGAVAGAGLGAGEAAITGGDIGTGALTGGVTGGLTASVGPLVGSTLDIGATAGDALTGAVVGGGASALTGGNPLLGAAEGGAGGLLSGALGSATSGTPAAPSVAPAPSTGIGGATSGAIASAPATIAPGPLNTDLTSTGGSALGGGTSGELSGGSTGGSSGGLSLSDAAQTLSGASTSLPTGTVDPNAIAPGTDMPYSAVGVKPDVPASPSLLTKGIDFAEGHPLLLAGGGLLAASTLMGNQPLPGQAQLGQEATALQNEGQQMNTYAQTGTLPPGAQQAVDLGANAAKARLKSSYASMGLSGSTMESQALGQVDEAKAAQSFQIANDLMKQGFSYTQLSDQIQQQLLQVALGQDTALQTNLGKFAAALGGAGLKGTS